MINYLRSDIMDKTKLMESCKNSYKQGREEVQKVLEALRVELTKKRDEYSQITERLWKIAHKK